MKVTNQDLLDDAVCVIIDLMALGTFLAFVFIGIALYATW